jgi:hypothetical protein
LHQLFGRDVFGGDGEQHGFGDRDQLAVLAQDQGAIDVEQISNAASRMTPARVVPAGRSMGKA